MNDPFSHVFVGFVERKSTGSIARIELPLEYSDMVSWVELTKINGITDWVTAWMDAVKGYVYILYGHGWQPDMESFRLVNDKVDAKLWINGDDTIKFIEYGNNGGTV